MLYIWCIKYDIMFSKKFICFSFLILIITISAVSATENITSENNFETSSNNETTNTFDYVQNTIENAEFNSTIYLNGTYEGMGKEIIINKDITIEGSKNTTLDANNKSKILIINSGNVVLKNINFINAYSKTNGGAITSNGQLTLINCNFINNSVNPEEEYNEFGEEWYSLGKGGAIYVENDLSVINSTFINNSAHVWTYWRQMDYVERVDHGEGGAIMSLGKLCIINSIFESNSIRVYNNISVVDSSFNNCHHDVLSGHDIDINKCNFTNCSTVIGSAYNIIINNSIFSNNKCGNVDNNGEAIIGIGGIAKIFNSTFINNSVRNNAILVLDNYQLKDCIFINNSDATIFSSGKMLDDSLNSFYLFEAKIKNKLTKVNYNSGKSVRVDVINVKSKEIIRLGDIKIYINNKYYDDDQFRKSIETEDSIYLSNYLIFPISTWKVGTYKIVVGHDNKYTKPITFKVTILKAKTIIKAPKVTAKYKKSKYFNIIVKNKDTKKVVKNIKIKIKVYTGKKYKTYTVKTNKNGLAKLNTKSLKIGKHKVVISSGNSNYQISAKSQITIKK